MLKYVKLTWGAWRKYYPFDFAFLIFVTIALLPLFASIHKICLPWDWRCKLDDVGAMASTANATWWLILATGGGAIATLSAVLIAVGQDSRRAMEKDQESTRINGATKQAIFDAYGAIRDVRSRSASLTPVAHEIVWDDIGNASSHIRTLEHYLRAKITSDDLVYQANAAIQRLYETRDALKRFGETGTTETFNGLHNTMNSVLRRIERDEPTLRAANVEVKNGVVPRIVSAAGRPLGNASAAANSQSSQDH